MLYLSIIIKKSYLMKKLGILIIAIFFVSKIGFGQVELGLSTGVNISNVQTTGVPDNFSPKSNFISSFRPALTLAIPLDDRFSILTGLAKEARGFDVFVGTEIEFLGINFPLGATLETRIHYIEIPLNFKLDFPSETRNIRPWIAAGANLGYAYAGDITTKINVIIPIKINETDLNLDTDAVRRFDIAPNILVGVDIPYKRSIFSFSLGYEHSVQNFLNDSVIGIETRHFGFTPAFGYSYALGSISKA